MPDSRALLAAIESFLPSSGMAASTFGARAVNDGKLVDRLRAGGSVRLETAEAVLAFIAARRPRKRRRS